MILNSGKWINFGNIWKIVVCLLLVSPVQLFPQQQKKNSDHSEADLKTLNSKPSNVNAKNKLERPVFDIKSSSLYSNKLKNSESEKSVADASKAKSTSDQVRQLNVPFMSIPSNWLATFQPSNAVILTQKVPLRIYAIGSVSRFPSFLENFLQRVQSYYSIYKYHDLSRPASLGIINQQYHQHDSTTIIDPMDQDPVEEDTETATMDYFDTTTDMNYFDDEEYTESSEDLGSGQITV